MVKRVLSEIISNVKLAENIFKVTFDAKNISGIASPGQFLHIKIVEGDYPLLRRPFSIHDVNEPNITILYQIKGVGTELLSTKKAGDRLDVMGPIGNGFNIDSNIKNSLLIGGGMGIAPMPFLAKKIRKLDCRVFLVYGVRNSSDLVETENLKKLADGFFICSEDGEVGSKGMVTELPLKYSDYDRIFACGPRPMLEAVSNLAKKSGVECEVSLEEQMACGIGACLGCSTKTKSEQGEEAYRRVCVDGPVFDSSKVIW